MTNKNEPAFFVERRGLRFLDLSFSSVMLSNHTRKPVRGQESDDETQERAPKPVYQT